MNEKLNVRQKLAYHLIILLLKILKPYQYEHEISKIIDEMNTLVKIDG